MFPAGKMEKFVIIFDKDLTVQHHITHREEIEVNDPKIFTVSSFLNFHEDFLKIEIHYENDKLNGSIKNKSVSYKTTLSASSENTVIQLTFAERKVSVSHLVTIAVCAQIKNVLLELFSPHMKQFQLFIDYVSGNSKYRSIYSIPIPEIKQKEWYAKSNRTDNFWPEKIFGGYLIKLYQKQFRRNDLSSEGEVLLQQQLIDYCEARLDEKFSKFDFILKFQLMIAIEDLFTMRTMKEFGLNSQKINHYRTCPHNLKTKIANSLSYLMCPHKMKDFLKNIYVIEATKKMPIDAQEFDLIRLTDMEDYQNFYDDLHEIAEQRIISKISYIFGNTILFKINNGRSRRSQNQTELDLDRHYHVEFVANRISVRVAHRAISDARSFKLRNYLKSVDSCDLNQKSKKGAEKVFKKFNWMNKEIKNNIEQQTAIENIVNCTSFPSPYILFGPPGTGKTSTIIEAIAQVIKLKPHSHILITSSSNSTCDDIGNRLLNLISINKILRIYSPSFDLKPEKLNYKLQPISNFRNRTFCSCKRRSCPEIMAWDDPTYEEFYTSRVIIATLVSCGRLVSAGIKSNHFDYIFIDEASSDSEPYTLIPISGLGASLSSINANIILSGDHKQLGPIVQDPLCCRMGMEMSFMERLMETNPKYQKPYNTKFVTQLVQNYRSHPAILQFSNENFYDSQLVPMLNPQIANFACGWELLSNKKFPMIFCGSRYKSEEVGTSLKNEGELRILDNYVKNIMQNGINGEKVTVNDIGIISPYRGQRDRIIETFQYRAELSNIEVGTVDSFQGKEKKIIILSTVRSQTRHVGFLRNEKRLNVALTRAKCLLIIIGNASTLQRCQIWNKFVAFCYENCAIVGDSSAIDHKNIANISSEGNEEIPIDVEDEYDE